MWTSVGRPATRTIGPTEAAIVLAAITGLYGAYVVTQLVVLAGGADHLLETADLTRADYARAGFFQLLWAAGSTLAVLLGLRRTTVRARNGPGVRLTALCLAVIALTMGLVLSSLVRLSLCNDAFGLTMLRLTSMVFAGWIGIVLVLVGPTWSVPVSADGCRSPWPRRRCSCWGRSIWSANWSRWDAARHRAQLGCPDGP